MKSKQMIKKNVRLNNFWYKIEYTTRCKPKKKKKKMRFPVLFFWRDCTYNNNNNNNDLIYRG